MQVLARAAACGTVASIPLAAHGAPVVSRPVVQQLPNPARGNLNEALARLGRNPRDIDALMDAGDAARAVGDFDAAIGFYRRADEIAPDNARIKAGFAQAYAMNGDPVSAIPYFDAAERLGTAPTQIAADRGLAYDLVGDNLTAQRYYAMAMASGGSDEVRMRLALSQAIGGDQKGAEATLMPLLRKQDKPGWRTRAFALAIGGDTTQAVSVAQTILPPPLAENIAPYLRYMPRLTKAQQAAAANLGHFPRASEIGRDDSRIAAYAPPRVAAADTGLVPKGEPLNGKNAKSGKASNSSSRVRIAKVDEAEAKRSEAARKAALASANTNRVAPPDPRPTIESGAGESSSGELPAIAPAVRPMVASTVPLPATVQAGSRTGPVQPPRVASLPASMSASALPSPPAASPSSPSKAATAATPGFDLARLQSPSPAVSAPSGSSSASAVPQTTTKVASASAPTAVAPATAPATSAPATTAPPAPKLAQAPAAAPRPSLSEIFAEFGKPTTQATPTAGAVDIRKIAPTRPDAKADDKVGNKLADKAAADKTTGKAADKAAADKAKAKKPAPPAHPSRIWVQIGVGRDKDAIAFDWRRYLKQYPTLFKGKQANVSEMGRTNRILVGPFETQKAANDYVASLKKGGFEGALPWTSPAGQVVDALSSR